MPVVTNPAVKTAINLPNGGTGLNATDTAVDSANGDSFLNVDTNTVFLFRATAAGAVVVTVYADINGVEAVIDSFTVPSNATNGGIRLWRIPKGINFGDHNVSCAGATAPADKRAGAVVFKAAGAAVSVQAFQIVP